MSKSGPKQPNGEMRRGQLITTFGPGAMLDLPKHSVLVGGLDGWWWSDDEPPQHIEEPRLQRKLAWLLKREYVTLRTPPALSHRPGAQPSGVRVWQFPEWFLTSKPLTPPFATPHRCRRLVHRRALDRSGRYPNPDSPSAKRELLATVPIRFVRACVRGHLDDIAWREFVHLDTKSCPGDHLWLEERGTSGDLSDSYVVCDACARSRPLIALLRGPEGDEGAHKAPLGFCNGKRPWLGRATQESCGGGDRPAQPFRVLIRSASNSYFPQLLSAISIPDPEEGLRAAVNRWWDSQLVFVEDDNDLRSRLKHPTLAEELSKFPREEVLAELARRRSGNKEQGKALKPTELAALLRSPDSTGEDRPDGDFFARTLNTLDRSQKWMDKIERVVLVHRLREVVAQLGFTRFEPVTPDTDGELGIEVERARIALQEDWVPATENRGEGVLLVLEHDVVEAWAESELVQARTERLRLGHEVQMRTFRDDGKVGLPGPRYVMLHSLAHLLVTAVALESGYAASAIRERVYAAPGIGYAILLYTGTPDSEGTLGGLVAVGRRMDRILRSALEMGRLCSNDPVCSQHEPTNRYEERYLHGASCHGCVLIAETCCERFNQYLDRALVVPTIAGHGCEFFTHEDLT